MQWYIDVLKKYAVFSGRARRKEFWMFVLISTVIGIVLSILDTLIGTKSESGTGLLDSLYSLAVLLPTIAVGVRRLHDVGRSGWWWLIALTIIGIVALIIFWAQEGKPGDNEHGPDPKAGERAGGEPAYPPSQPS